MHEYSIVQALLDRVDEELHASGGSRAHRVRVSIGELAGVDVELLKTAYSTIRHRTSCESATLEVQRVEARWHCSRCGIEIVRGKALRCPACGRAATLASGDEITLDQIEMEAA
jgi:hydrogenase nickel incorporation protein HypA/HybF